MNSSFKQVEDLVTWVSQSNYEVDTKTFLSECDKLVIRYYHNMGMRVPMGILGRGVQTLDIIYSANRSNLPSEILWSNLPGSLRERVS